MIRGRRSVLLPRQSQQLSARCGGAARPRLGDPNAGAPSSCTTDICTGVLSHPCNLQFPRPEGNARRMIEQMQKKHNRMFGVLFRLFRKRIPRMSSKTSMSHRQIRFQMYVASVRSKNFKRSPAEAGGAAGLLWTLRNCLCNGRANAGNGTKTMDSLCGGRASCRSTR